MSETKHTPEAWYTLTGSGNQIEISNTISPNWASPKHYVAHTKKANATRIVACVNALAGMAPEALAGLVEAAEEAGERFLIDCDPALMPERFEEAMSILLDALAALRGES